MNRIINNLDFFMIQLELYIKIESAIILYTNNIPKDKGVFL